MSTLTRQDYARRSLELLAESGVSGVTIAAVCAQLGVTKGSFYHHFAGVTELQQAMLDVWEELYGQARPEALSDLPPMERLDATVTASVERAHEIEAAIRTWSASDERVAEVQRRLDDLRIAFVSDTLTELGVAPDRARVLAGMGLAMLIGFQARAALIDRHDVRTAITEWRRVLHSAVEEASTPTNEIDAA